MPYIQRALNDLKVVEPNGDRRQVLVNILKTPMKLASIIVRLGFLLSCRKSGVVPRFIDNATSSVDKIFAGSEVIQRECKTFRVKLLNESIKDAFRNKAFLERCQRRQEGDLRQVNSRIFTWMKTACRAVFEDTLYTGRQRVERKFRQLIAHQLESRTRAHSGHGRDDTDKNPLQEGSEDRPPAQQAAATTTKRVTNLSSIPVAPSVMNVLSKGPKFAMTTKINETILREVESGVERLAYGKRWKDYLERSTNTPNTTGVSVLQSSAPRAVQQQEQREQQQEQQEEREHRERQPIAQEGARRKDGRFTPITSRTP